MSSNDINIYFRVKGQHLWIMCKQVWHITCLFVNMSVQKQENNYSLQYLNEWFSRFPISVLSCLLSSNTEKSILFYRVAYNYPRSSWFIGVFLTIYAYYNVECLISAFSLICDSYSIFWNTYRLGNECTNISLILYKYIF